MVYSLLVGILLETLAGDPEGWPHPVRLLGAFISLLESVLRRSRLHLRFAGLLLVIIVSGTAVLAAWLLRCAFAYAGAQFVIIYDGILLYLCLAANQLLREARRVHSLLEKDSLEEARKNLSRLVSRETEQLDEAGITRATLETLTENFCDGVFAPLFYFALFGPYGAMAAVAYKAVNTMDSMVGYKNEKYAELGWAAARLDDIVNWVPARVAALLLVLSARLAGLSGRNALRILLRDHRKHESPNAAWCEAAGAGALRVRLGGPVKYALGMVERPYIGDEQHTLSKDRIREAIRLVLVACIVSGAFAAGLLLLWDVWISTR